MIFRWWRRLANLRTKFSQRKARSVTRPKRSPELEVENLEHRILFAARVWNGAVNANWSTAANWDGGVLPQAGDDLIFGPGGSHHTNTNDLAAGTLFNTIQFSGSDYSINGNAIQLNGGLAATNATGNNTFNVAITLRNAEMFVSGNAGTKLTLGGVVDTANLVGTTGILGTSAVTVDGAGDLEIAGRLTGQGSLEKAGSGTLFLTGANDYAGITRVTQGVINVQNATGLGLDTAGTMVATGAALQVQGDISVNEPLSISEAGIGFGDGIDTTHPVGLGALRSISGANVWTGGIELIGGNNLIGVDAGSLNITSVIGGTQLTTHNLLKVGSGTLQLSGTSSNTFIGSVTALQGTLELNKRADPVDPASGIKVFQSSLIIGNHIGGDNTATVRLMADNQIPELDFFNTTINSVTVNSSGLLELNNRSDTIGTLTIFEGATYSGDITTGSGTLILGGPSLTLNAFQGSSPASTPATIRGKLDLGTSFSGTGGGTTKTFAINNSALTSVDEDLIIYADISGTSDISLTRTGAGSLTLAGNNSYHGPTILNTNGVTRLASDSPFGDGLLSIQNNSVVFRAIDGARTVTNTVSIDSNFAVRGSNNLTFSGRATLTGGRTITVLDPNETTTFSGGIGEGFYGSQNLAKSGRGTLVLSGINTYSGSTTVNSDGGTLLLTGGGTLLNSSAFTVADNGTFAIDNSGQAAPIDRLNDLAGITLNGGELAFTGSAGAPSETVGIITLGGNLSSTIRSTTSAGVATNLIADALTFNNGATVQFVGVGAPLSTNGPNRITFINTPTTPTNGILPFARVEGPGGTLDFATYASVPEGVSIIPLPASGYYTGDINAADPTANVHLAAGTYTLTGSRTINALLLDPGVTINGLGTTLTVGSGAIMMAAGAASVINVETLNLGAQAYLTVIPGGTGTINSTIVGAATSITKAGGGKLILTGDNQFGGAMNVNGGVLNIQRSTALGATAGATNVRQGAALEIQETTFGPVNVLLETLNLTGTGVNDTGALRNIAGANNSWAGNIALTPVSLDGPSLFPSSNAIVISGSMIGVDSGHLTLSGVISGSSELIKLGAGMLELSGINANTYTGSTRIKEGTLLLNKYPGLNAVVGSPVFVGDDDGVGAPGVLQWGASDQVPDGATIQLGSTGQANLNGFNDAIGGLVLTIGPNGASSVSLGSGTLTLNGNLTVQEIGLGNPTGATISGGTLALALFGTSAATTRTFLVNDGATGDDLTISSAIVDGTGLQSIGLTKTGFGTLVYQGTTANTYTGTTTVSEGQLALDKGTITGGVNAFNGPLTIGDTNPQSGFANSDVVVLRKPEQIPDLMAPVTIQNTGLLNLNGYNETIGNVDASTALTLNMGNITTGIGILTINGNIVTVANQGAVIFTPLAAPTIQGSLNLGSLTRIIDVQDQAALAIDAIISANIVDDPTAGVNAGLIKNNNGFLLLSGNNTYSGDTFINSGTNGIAVGSNTALGTGRVYFVGSSTGILAFGGPRTVTNDVYLSNGRTQFGYWNDLTFSTGLVNGVGGTITATTVNAVAVEFKNGIGESFGATALTKEGFGRLILSGVNTYSGQTIINANAGSIILRDGGTAINSSQFTVNVGASLILDNDFGANLADRIGDVSLTLSGGTLTFIGQSGAASSEYVGTITLNTNFGSTIQSQAVPGSKATLISNALARNAGATVNFMGLGQDLDTLNNQIRFVGSLPQMTSPGDIRNILPYATVTSVNGQLDFASQSGVPGTGIFALPAAGYVNDINSAGPGDNVRLTSSAGLTGDRTIQSLLLVGDHINVSGSFNLTIGDTTLRRAAVAAQGTGNVISATTLTAGIEAIVSTYGDLEIQSAINNLAGAVPLTTTGSGTLALTTNASSFTGATVINQGTVRAQKDTAFGTVAGGVTVQFGATLELSGGINVGAEALNIQGSGAATNIATLGLRSASGDNTWAGAVTLTGANGQAVGVSVENGSLNLSGAVGQSIANVGLNKLGSGTLQFSGSSANTYANTTTIYQGILQLNKSAGVNALAGAVVIGDHIGANDADVLQAMADNQIIDTTTVTVNSSGLYDLNNRSESFGPYGGATNALNLFVGPTSSAEVRIGTGTLALIGSTTTANAANVLVSVLQGGSPQAVQITSAPTGMLTIQNQATAGTTINVSDTASVEDLIVSANIADGTGAGSILKSGNGRLVLSGNNSYTGTTTLTAGTLNLQSDTALGSTASGTVVTGGALQLQGGRTITGEALSITGTGVSSTGALRSLNGNNVWTGPITLTGNITVGVDADQLTLSGVISGATFGVTKILPGTLIYAGLDSPNTYTGTTIVNQGKLELSKTTSGAAANLIAIAGPLTIGNDAGGDDADVVLFDQAGQIDSTQAVIINSSGLLNLNGNNQTLAAATALVMTFGPTFSANVATGSGTLTLGGNVAINQVSGTSLTSSSPGAEIGGNLSLGGGAWTFTVAQNAFLPNEGRISATINDGGAGGSLIKAGTGTLSILADNSTTYSGTTTLSAGNLSLGNDGALGTGSLNVTGAGLIRSFPGTGARTIANPVTLNNNLTVGGDQNFTFGGLVMQVGAARTITINANTAAKVDFAGGINLGGAFILTIAANNFNSTHSVSGAIVDGTDVGALTKSGNGVLVLSSNTSSFTGQTLVTGGILRITANGALGSTVGNTQVNGGAQLQVVAGLNVAEPLNLNANGGGFANFGALRFIDTNSAVSETSTWSGPITLTNTNFIRVDGGGATPDTLDLGGSGLSTITFTGNLTKTGPGTIMITGTAANTGTGGVTVNEGTLTLNKTGAGSNAIGTGAITVGDHGGGANADRLIIGNNTNVQFPAATTVTVNSSGLFDMTSNSVSPTIGALNLNRSFLLAPTVDSGTQNLTLGGTVTVSNFGFTDGSSPAATIAGNLGLGAARTFTVNDSLIPNSAEDLVVSAVISGAFTLTSNGAGTMALTAANTYTGATTVSAAFNGPLNTNTGTLVLRDGGTVASGSGNSFTVNSGATLVLDNTNISMNRVFDTAGITLAGGALSIIGNGLTGTTENVGTITINAGTSFSSTISSTTNGGMLASLTSTSLSHGAGGVVHFIGVNADLGSPTNDVRFTAGTSPFVNGVIPYATISGPAGFDLVTDADGTPSTAPYVIGRVLSYANDINAPGNAIVRLDGTEPLINRKLNGPNTIAALLLDGGVTVTGANTLTVGTATAGLIVNRGGNNTLEMTTLAFGTLEPLFLAESTSTLNVSSSIIGSGTLRKEHTGTLILSGNNQAGVGFTGAITINQGQLIARNNNAFGTTAGSVTVNNLATLVLDGGLTIGNESLTLNGTAALNNGQTGVLQVVNGSSTWGTGTTTVNWNSNPIVVSVSTGNTLTLNAMVGTGGNGLTKIGGGILELAGTVNNTYTGTTTVNEGTLRLNKSGANIRALNGALIIGDFSGVDIVEYGTAATGGDQIANAQNVTVNSGAQFNLNGQSDQITNLTMTGGSVSTGAGVLTFTGTLTYNVGSQALISGNLNLGGAARSFVVADGAAVNDLVITAVVSNGGITKTNAAGTLLLDPAGGTNSYTLGTILQGGVFALGSPNALGTGTLTLNTANSTLRPKEGIDLVGANAVANIVAVNLPANGVLTLGGRRDFGGTGGIELTGGGTFPNSDFRIQVDDPQVNARISGNFSGGGATAVFHKQGNGKLILSGNNTFTVAPTVPGTAPSIGTQAGISIDGGILTVANSNALGVGDPANVNVRGDLFAAMEIDGTTVPVNLINRNLVLFFPDNSTASGFLNSFTGTLRNIAGNNSVTGTIDLRNIAANGNNGSVYIGVDSGLLDLNGTIQGSQNVTGATLQNNRNLYKVGGGTLRTSGTTGNTLTLTTFVMAGTLELNKSPGTAGAGIALAGPLVVGDNDGPGTDTVRLLANEQIPLNLAITVNCTGLFDLGNFSNNTSTTATLVVGATSSAQVTTSVLGDWIHRGDVIVNIRPGILTAVPVTISGNLQLTNTAAATRTFTVNDSPGTVELQVTANISDDGTNAGALTKAGAGRMVLRPTVANTYLGVTTVNAGALMIQNINALGSTTANTVVNSGGVLEVDGTAGNLLAIPEPITINGSGIINGPITAVLTTVLGTGALRNVAGDNTWAGTVTIGSSNSAIGVDGASSLGLAGVVAFGNNLNTVKVGAGKLELSGSAANTFTTTRGTLFVNQGTLSLNKAGTAIAVPVNLTIGDNVGGDNADQVVYAATAGTDQIDNSANVVVNSSGLLDLTAGNQSDTINALTLGVGPSISGDVQTSTTVGVGMLTLNNNVTVLVQSGTTAASVPTTISGKLALPATRTFTVNDGAGTVELDVSAVISGAGGVTKNSYGALQFSGTGENSYAGTTTVNAGTLLLNKTGVLAVRGALTIGDNVGSPNADLVRFLQANQILTTVAVDVTSTGWLDLNNNNQTFNTLTVRSGTQSGALVSTGTGTLTMGTNNLTHAIVGTGWMNATIGGILNLGNVTRTFTVSDNVGTYGNNDFDLDIAATLIGTVAAGSNALVVVGPGTLRLSGPSANTYTGDTRVNSGTLLLAKLNGNAVPGNLFIGDGTGGNDADVVRLAGNNQISDTANITIANSGLLDSSGIDEMQAVVISAATTGGSFTLTVPGFGTTQDIPFSATPSVLQATIQAALDMLLGAGNTFVSVVTGLAGPPVVPVGFLVTFLRDFGETNIGLMTVNSSLTPTGLAAGQVIPIKDGLPSSGFSDTIGPLTMSTGTAALGASDIYTGSGIVTLNGNVTLNGTATDTVGGLIYGHISLGTATRTFTIADNVSTFDLDVRAAISNGTTGVGLIKTGPGELHFSSPPTPYPVLANTYDGTTTVQDGTLSLAKQAGQNAAIAGPLVIGDDSGAITDFVRLDANDQIGDNVTVSVSSSGRLNLNDSSDAIGVLNLKSGTVAGADVTTGLGTLTLGGDVALTVFGTGASGATINGNLNLGAVTRTFTIADGSAQNDLNISAVVSSTGGGLSKAGPGTLRLAASNTYSGPTTVAAGSLVVDGSTAAGSAVAVNGGFLRGKGIINGTVDVNSGGTLAPGDVAVTGILTVNNNVAFNAGSSFVVRINGTTPGTDFDQLVIAGSGTLTIDGSAGGAQVMGSGSFIPTNGTAFLLINKTAPGPVTGNFANAVPPSPPAQVFISGKSYNFTYAPVVPGQGFELKAAGTTREWDGGSPTDSNWTTAANWVGDVAPFAGDDLLFRDLGLVRSNPFNDYAANTFFNSITFSTTTGSYNLQNNAVQLAGSGGVFNQAGNNTVSFGLSTANNPQTFQSNGTLTIAGNVTLATNLTLDGTGSVTLNGILAGSGNVTKQATGTATLGGTAANTYSGTVTVNAGKLQLNKTAGLNAITGALVIGDDLGGANADVVQLLAADQIANAAAAAITVHSSGLLDLNGKNETITGPGGSGNTVLTLVIGPTFSANVSTGTGTLSLGGAAGESGVKVTALPGTSGTSPAAFISGNLSLGTQTRTFTVADTATASPAVDLDVTAIVSNGGLTKNGPGTLRLGAVNTYAAATTVNGGNLQLDGSTAAGSAVAVNNTAFLSGVGTINGTLTINNGGTLTPGVGGPSLLTINNTLTFNSGSLLVIEINGTMPATQYDQLRVTGTGDVIINAGALLNGTTSINPVNGVDSFVIIDKQSAGAIIGNFANAVPPSPPNQVFIGVKSYNFTYTGNTGNDFVLTATKTSRVWDGGSASDNNWSDPLNWVNDQPIFAGDDLIFNDTGVQVRNTPFNDFAPNTPFSSITLSTTLGNYTLTGNGVFLSAVNGGVFNLLGTNSVNLNLVTGGNPQAFTSNAGTLSINGNVTLGTNLTLDGAGTGVIPTAIIQSVAGVGITKQGAGTWILHGSNNYSGATTLNGGRLEIDGNQPASSVVVNSGTLTGTGVVGSVTVNNGTVQPGPNAGFLTAVGNVNFNPSTTLIISSTTQLKVTGNVTTNNSTLEFMPGSNAAVGSQSIVIDNLGSAFVSGIFRGMPQGKVIDFNGAHYKINYFGGNGNDIILSRAFDSDLIVTGADAGGSSEVKVYVAGTGALFADLVAYNPSFSGGVHVAVGDVNGDGIPDIITGPGAGGGPLVNVYSGKDLSVLASFNAYDPAFLNGVFVAAGDVNGDGYADIITAPDVGGGPLVQAFSGKDMSLLIAFNAYDPSFRGGVHVAAGDVDGDGKAEIITGPGIGGGPLVNVFNAQNASLQLSFNAYALVGNFLGGVFVGAGDLTGDGKAEIITGPGFGGGALVTVFEGVGGGLQFSFNAYNSTVNVGSFDIIANNNQYRSGVRVAAADFNGDGRAEILTGAGPLASPDVRLFDSVSLSLVDEFFAYDPLFSGGIFVGGGR